MLSSLSLNTAFFASSHVGKAFDLVVSAAYVLVFAVTVAFTDVFAVVVEFAFAFAPFVFAAFAFAFQENIYRKTICHHHHDVFL